MYNSSWWLLTRIDALDYFHATAFTQFSWRYRCPVKGVGTSWIVVAIALETFDFVSSYFLKDFQILEDFLSFQLWNPRSFKGKFTDIFILFLDLILSILGYWILLKLKQNLHMHSATPLTYPIQAMNMRRHKWKRYCFESMFRPNAFWVKSAYLVDWRWCWWTNTFLSTNDELTDRLLLECATARASLYYFLHSSNKASSVWWKNFEPLFAMLRHP